MDAIFDDITISWMGTQYTIKGDDRIMMLLAQIEEVLTAKELFEHMQNHDVPLIKLSFAYSKVLNFVGVKVTAAQVYSEIFKNMTDQEEILGFVVQLVQMLLPKDYDGAATTGKKRKPHQKRTQGAKSSSKHSKQQSAKAG